MLSTDEWCTQQSTLPSLPVTRNTSTYKYLQSNTWSGSCNVTTGSISLRRQYATLFSSITQYEFPLFTTFKTSCHDIGRPTTLYYRQLRIYLRIFKGKHWHQLSHISIFANCIRGIKVYCILFLWAQSK